MGNIVLENVCLTFGEHELFKNLSDTFEDGKIYVLMGPSGGGKSTLLKVISGLTLFDKGDIWVDGENMRKYNKNQMLEYHTRSGFVFQNAALISNMSVFDNLSLYYHYHTAMTDEEIMDKLQYYLDYVGFHDDLSLRPNTLSTGERMMVSIIRAISHDPEYIFLDEPVANLDSAASKKVRDIVVDQRSKGKTIIMVTHDTAFAFPIADKIGILADGRIIESGSPDEIRASTNSITRSIMNLD